MRPVIAICMAFLHGVALADCSLPVPALDAGVWQSRWEEFNAQGRKLLREKGTLHTQGLSLGSDCGAMHWTGRISQVNGLRAYRGVSSSDMPLQTSSRIEQQQARLVVLREVSAAWSLGASLGYRRIQRDIAGVGLVEGYPERFDDWQATAGLRFAAAGWNGLKVSAEAWLGAGPKGSMLLRLPHADPATLRLGPSRMAQLGLQVSGKLAGGLTDRWSWQLRLDQVAERFAAGAGQAIFRNGILIGGAAQPETHQSALSLLGVLRYSF